MALVKSYSEIPNPRSHKIMKSGYERWRTAFWDAPKNGGIDSPVAFLHEGAPFNTLRTHFHMVDQFQIIYLGSGKLGRHQLGLRGVHFSRAYTPYGPLVYDAEGLGFVTLRAHVDPGGAQKLPERMDVLKAVPNRNPWQVTEMPDFSIQPDSSGVAMKAFEKMYDDRGLAAWSLVMKPGARALGPDPSRGDGQYIVVLQGGIVDQGNLKPSLALVWVGKDDGPFALEAGPEGCEAVIVNFPVPGGGRPAHMDGVSG